MRICLFALAALVGGCHWDLNDRGTEPKTGQLYFPSGITMDPGGRYAYVSNGNADLRFGGGTVMVVDMLAFECTVARFAQRWNDLHPTATPLPVRDLPPACGDGAQWDPVVDGALCRPDPVDPSIVDCDETAFILQNSTVKIGNFAGSIRLLVDPDDPTQTHRTLFVAVRGDPSISKIDVHFPGGNTAVPASINEPGVLQCVPDPTALARRKQYDPVTHTTTEPAPCDATSLVQQFKCEGLPTCELSQNDDNVTQLPSEPFGMQVDDSILCKDGSGGHCPRLLVSHLLTGQVSVIDTSVPAPQALLSESSAFFSPDTLGRHGAFALAKQHPQDPASNWYMTSNVNPQIATFRLGESDLVIPQTAFAIATSFSQGTDVRDIIFDVDGNRAFITENNPPSLIVMDTRPAPDAGTLPNNVITDIVNVCQTPSHMGVRRLLAPGAPGEPTRVKNKVVVVCFLSSQVMIVDPDRPGVDDTVFSGLGGPNDLAFNFPSYGDTSMSAINQLTPAHAYVTNYTESTISVIDLQPHSVTENRVIARLGFPPDGFNP